MLKQTWQVVVLVSFSTQVVLDENPVENFDETVA